MGQIWSPFGVLTYLGHKNYAAHNYGNCALIDLKFGRLVQLNDV